MAEILLWITGLSLLLGVIFYSASLRRKDRNAAGRVIEKRNLRRIQSPENQPPQVGASDLTEVEHLNPKENQDG